MCVCVLYVLALYYKLKVATSIVVQTSPCGSLAVVVVVGAAAVDVVLGDNFPVAMARGYETVCVTTVVVMRICVSKISTAWVREGIWAGQCHGQAHEH